ncbi:MAG: hypothetical protein SWH78_16195 [Thermodesulfobacteriota bacterium]|nr:hypothetical protein [Thermodesulfobacteriota bacterium]
MDENENSVLDTGEPSTNVAMPSEFIQQLDFPAEVSISEGVHPSITFSSVSNADRYLLRIFRINESGNPDSSLLLDQSEVIEDDGSPSYCYQYTGDAFQTYGSTLTIAIEAYEDGPCDSVVNRSRYYVQHTVPVTGACCLPDGSCMEAMAIECASAGGTYQGDGIDCASANCSLCFSNSDCGPEFYCAKPEGDCDGEGACTPLPEFCPMVIDEVCGCDGETYMNGCEAAMAGVSIAHLGACDVGTLCSTLGDDPRRYAPDMDVFKFSGSEGETVTVTLESSPPEYGAGQRAVLIIRSLCRGLRLFKRFNDALPLVMTVTLPVTGDYHVKVMEAPGRAVIWGEKYKGDYCLTLEASPYTVATFVPDLDIE